MKTINQIRTALEKEEFYLVYMPTMDLKTRQCVGAEALIRWNSNGENIPPDEFIPRIENTPLSGLITYWVIEQVAKELKEWLDNTEGVHVGINVPPELIGRGGLEYAAIKAGLMDSVDKIILEVTERGFPDQLALNTLGETKDRIKVAIDDFGTGDANMMQLSRMRADIIKLDKFFIDHITDSNPQPGIVHGLVAFAKAMGFDVIAEGVETQIQYDYLTGLHVNMAQGWFFSKPLRLTDFLNFASQPH
ncbi:MAG: EAL domain-containing protein [Gammaproteobacteria bacterium]|jgi:sensor c-di-GMP phosphodiesterase-like protein